MHKPFYTAFFLIALVASGCTQTRHIGTSANDDVTFDELHKTLEGRHVELQLRDQRMIPSRALVIRADSIWAIDELTGNVRGAATYDVAGINYNKPGRGAWHGAVLGAAAGSLVGLATGLGLTTFRDEDQATTSVAYYVSVPTAFWTIVGFGSGMLLGVRKGSRDHYVYPDIRLNVQAEPSMIPMPSEPMTMKQPN